ncbi:DUF2461 domain-containing protein [Permianibacter aggregans]|uniref:Uncharacterized protein (TIGR02453 family) n=1 Tax=Permianibacter aggregans TaxID=1510150 RepID=A0A4R6UUX2_9GAMM|nr:DUF2461 domain-containing protein [Permianibacter aggregans]QGX39537.1 DUF2461 domain-containing protein [Permianibacter aggregans]TDQ49719.1 uncharacterized protein (TIGR02453 family) [Permianibacter aggregans]
MSEKFFSPATFAFLRQLQTHNERKWFETHKDEYEQRVREPALAFISAMQQPMLQVSKAFDVVPKKVGGSLMRVYRDTRFATDKTPYKTNVGIQLRHQAGKDVHAPGFYIHLSPDECFLGVGIWRPDAPALKQIRAYIADNPNAWSNAIGGKNFRRWFALTGDSLQRMPRGYDENHPHAEDLKRKDFIAVHNFSEAQACRGNFPEFCQQRFLAAQEFIHTLCDALELPF